MAKNTVNLADKYPEYDPKHWYLSILKPKNARFTYIVAIRSLLNKPNTAEIPKVAFQHMTSLYAVQHPDLFKNQKSD